MGSSSGKTNEKPSMWRVFQITAYNEVTCAHTVLEPNSQFDISSLRFEGREAKLVIAARNYCVLRRFKPREHETHVAELDASYSMLVSGLVNRLHFSSFYLSCILTLFFCLSISISLLFWLYF